MRFKRWQKVRLFSMIATILMIYSLITPAFVAAETNEKSHRSLSESQLNVSKISDRLLDEFNEEEKVTFLIKFSDKMDVNKVAEEAEEEASASNLSGWDARQLKRSSILSELKETSFESQKDVMAFLEEEKEAGTVEDFHSYNIVNGMAVTATKEIAEKIATFPEVDKLLKNETRQLNNTTITEDEAPQSNLENVEWNVERVGAPESWELGIDGTGTVVASLDTGAEWNHPGLKEKYRGYDTATGKVNHQHSFFDAAAGRSDPYDDNGHGTHVTGTMVGSEPDGSNRVGVAPGAEWISVKVFNGQGETSDATLLEGADWLLAPGGRVDLAPDVVNNSWAGGPGLDEWYMDVVENWRAYDIFPEFSAGNTTPTNPGGPESIAVPANYPVSFATGATDADDMVADFSLRGPSPYDEVKPDISAPGVNIRSTVPGGDYEGGWDGTSMAGPAVAGVAALLRQVDLNISVDQMEEILIDTATQRTDDEYPESPNNGYGWGLVNAHDAVVSIMDDLGNVEGQVTKEGDDDESPTFEHTPVTETFAGMDVELSVQAKDNVSVTSVELQYEIDGGETKVVEAYRMSGNYTDGEYRADISGEDIEGDQLKYKWVINDFGNNEVVSDEYEMTIKSGVTPGYEEDFDEEPIGWTSFGENDYWEWGVPESGPGSADSGDNVYATHLAGPYGNNMNATLLMPPVELPDDDLLFMEFNHWFQFEESPSGDPWDKGHVVISTDQENWTELMMVEGTSEGWLHDEIDLSDYAGERVFIGFRASSDGQGIRDGWYIDEVGIYDSSRFDDDNENPTFNHDAPESTFVGTDMELTLEAEDNTRLNTVELEYLDGNDDWTTVEAELQSGNYISGTFTASVPEESITGDTVTYRWIIEDYGENSVVSDDYVVQVEDHVTIGYFEDMQTKPDGWYSVGENDNWEWGEPTSGPGSAYLGENVYATNLDDVYESNMDSTLMMPPMELPEDDAIYLELKHWYSLEGDYDNGESYDFGHVVISTDREEWIQLETFTGDSEGWIDEQIDLSDYAGQRVYVGFNATSDDNYIFNRDGWYIDQVALYDSTKGDDDEAPEFSHAAPPKAFADVDLHLDIEAQDNIEIETVEVSYMDENNDWKNVEADLQSGNYRSGLFEAVIPGEDITGDIMTYRLQVEDHANNQTKSENYDVDLQESITVGHTEDFETEPIGWNSQIQFDQNDDWEWGVPTSGPHSATSGEKVYATNVSGNYINDMHSILVMPPVDLPEGAKSLDFKSWHSFEESRFGKAWDYGEVVISTDRQDWTPLEMFQGHSSGWTDAQVDLSEYSGKVFIGFRAFSDTNGTYDGWYIDDVELVGPEEGAADGNHLDLGVMNSSNTGAMSGIQAKLTNNFIGGMGDKKLNELEKSNEVEQLAIPKKDDTGSMDDSAASPAQLPLGATINVLESGKTVSTNPADGSYSLYHNAGTFTLEASAYGFKSEQQSVEIETDETATANFNLSEITEGTIHGTVTDEVTGEAIPDARVMLVEDANVDPVETDENGNFTLTAYEGTYTLKVMARNYQAGEAEVTVEEGTVDVNIELAPYYTYPGDEISYDDGTAENARAFFDGGNGWGVKMTLPEGKESALVTDGVFQFHNDDWPSPGGTHIAVEVWDTGDDGMPGEKIAGPIETEAIRDLNEWTVVDLRDEHIVVNDDFYMVYIQQEDDPYTPGLATDESGPYAERSYQYIDGIWEQSPQDEGNYMIRARVDYELEEPVITSPEDGVVTNESDVIIEGEASPGTNIQLLNNGEEAGMKAVDANGKFEFEAELTDGDNKLAAVTMVDGERTLESESVTVTLDTKAPELTIDSPKDGVKTNRETATIEGTVSDEYLDTVEVNGQKADVTGDGTYSQRILLDEGENTIEVIATDLAGNTEKMEITIDAKYTAPEINSLVPEEDKDLETGETVKIEFDSDPGLEASFSILMPLTNNGAQVSNAIELPIRETSDGHYVGYWTVTSNVKANGAVIEVKVADSYGNKTTKQTEGTLIVNIDNENGSDEKDEEDNSSLN